MKIVSKNATYSTANYKKNLLKTYDKLMHNLRKHIMKACRGYLGKHRIYKGRSINKLQNGIILIMFII